ncbi:unnamed protein product [Rotaria sordida]|uniref:Uncharacterized protein n=1 Tax=Rotaria sordida TaxID=392033 RepID=A0A815APF2_9BILA|nr:unnamed protein product [Rotaria sordida]CAF1520029.1 unnamed protein product [Rotaria sordida]
MFVATSSTLNNNHPPSYIVAATTTTTATTNIGIDPTTSSTTPQTLSDIKLICFQRKKKTKRHIYLTFVESCPLLSTTEEPCIEIIRKSNSSSQSLSYSLNECISYEYFDTVKNDFHSFIYVYFESYTISIFFSDDNLDKKSLIIKHLDHMSQSNLEKSSNLNTNSSQDPTQSQSSSSTTAIQQQQQQQQQQQSQQTPILPCFTTTEHILHTFDVNLIPYGSIINRDHMLIGPVRLYFTTTDLYIASLDCNRTDLKITITNQCPSKDKAILCIPYFTIKNYGNRSNIFLIELGKSNYGNGEIHMKCHSSSLAGTIHLLVSPVIEERPLILSSAFQNQLLTNKRMEKSKNIQPPIQLNNDTTNQSILDSPFSFIKNKKPIETTDINSNMTSTKTNEIKSHLIVGFFRSLTKNVSNLRRSATFHGNNNNSNNNNSNNNSEQLLTIDNNSLLKNKSVAFNVDEKYLHNDQHQIILPEYQKQTDSTLSVSSTMTKRTSETILTSTSTINTNKQESTIGTYIDMGLTMQHSDQHQQQETQDEIITKEITATAEIGVNTTISLSPHVRSAIIVGNSVHLIADEHNLFPIGQRSFTSPASVMQPFKTQLTGQTITNGYGTSSDLITSSPDSSSSLQQTNSVSNSHKSLLLSYGIVTFNNNDCVKNDQTELATSPISDSITFDHRLNSDLSLMSISQQQQQGSTIHPIDTISSSSSNAHIFHTVSLSANSIGGDITPCRIRRPHSSILLFDDHVNDQITTYLLGPPQNLNDDTIQSRLPSFNSTTSVSRSQLSHIDEEKISSNDPYALVEPLLQDSSSKSTLVINSNSSLPQSETSINYADLLIPSHITNEYSDNNEQQEQQQQQQINNSDDIIINENDTYEEQDCENNERSLTKLYADIDFQQTRRYDRIVQSAAKAKLDDQTPPFVL